MFSDLFIDGLLQINPDLDLGEIDRLLKEVSLLLDNEDLGKAFYERITSTTGTKLIDFDNFDKNNFHVVTELTCKNGDEEFRPDITLLINGMPLVFIEVKKPNNRDGIIAERNRINTRFRNPKFRRFVNITQLMVFSNNMEYDDSSPEPISLTPLFPKPFSLSQLQRTPDLADPTISPPWIDRTRGLCDSLQRNHSNEISRERPQQRVRGIGFCPTARQNFRAKLRIPKGWHQNICDPNVETSDPEWNRHEALPDFEPNGFGDFVRKVATMWNIDLDWEAELL